MQKLLNTKYESIQVERDKWEAEKDEVKAIVKLDSEIIAINVGGKNKMQTEKAVLESVEESKLAALFSGLHEVKKDENGDVFVDRDGKTFEYLVNYLRNERRVFPDFADKNEETLFIKELHFWGIDRHNR